MKNKDKLRHILRNYRIDIEEYIAHIEDLYFCDKVQLMETLPHHKEVDCLEHSLRVSIYSYNICKLLRLKAKMAARGALLHDLFLYNWSKERLEEGLHGFVHPGIALKNARKITNLTKIEEDIIIKHMFPLTLRPPMYFESVVVCMVDKYVATLEFLGLTRKHNLELRKSSSTN